MEIASLSAIHGTDSYVTMRYELASLAKAEEGAQIVDKTSDDVKNSTDLGEVLTKLFSGSQDGQDHLLCAAYIMGKLPVLDKDYRSAAQILISTYNRRVEQMQKIDAKTKRQMVSGSSSQSAAAKLRRAEEEAALDKQQRQVSQDTLDAVGFSIMLSIDTGDLTSKTTEYMKFSCAERQDILDRSKELVSRDADDFQSAGHLIFDAVSSHKCR
ncbi:MAG TPA: hypothetical protein VIJ65_10760 [Acidobacteriaceae bacterium]